MDFWALFISKYENEIHNDARFDRYCSLKMLWEIFVQKQYKSYLIKNTYIILNYLISKYNSG